MKKGTSFEGKEERQMGRAVLQEGGMIRGAPDGMGCVAGGWNDKRSARWDVLCCRRAE